MNDPVADLAALAGILPRYSDLTGAVKETGRDTQLALLSAMGLGVSSEADTAERIAALRHETKQRPLPHWLVVEPDQATDLPHGFHATWNLRTEDGSEFEGRGRYLPPLPLGIHALSVGDKITTILSAPRSLPLPDRGWGVTAPLWGLRGPDRAGFGDFHDLRLAGNAVARHGAAFLGINPIHAGFAVKSDWFSPYSPSHRRRLNSLFIATGDGVATGLHVDYAREIPAKRAVLRAAFDDFTAKGEIGKFDSFLSQEGDSLRNFAAHQALSERHGALWTEWPAASQSPSSASLDGLGDEIRFHSWLQWKAHLQLVETQASLSGAGMRFGLYFDLAVGTHPAGAETWTDGAWFARDVSLGAPADPFAPDGQTWNLAPLNPRALIQGQFRILAETLRHQFTYARILRIDHILGFDRAYWLPATSGLPGAYVRMPLQAMLAVVRIEAARAGATVIGEDLGNIPAGLQEALATSGILGSRLAQFEQSEGVVRAPKNYPARSLASFGTHDLPTWAGWRTGVDIAARASLGHIDRTMVDNVQAARRKQVRRFENAAGGNTQDAMHRFLARTNSALVAVQVEDILDVKDQTNLPGTVHDYPNWRHKLPVAAGDLADDPRLARTAAAMKQEGR